MPEEAPQSTPPPAVISNETPTPVETPPAPIPFNIGEEFGTARKNLPPLKIVLIPVAIIAVIAGIVAFVQKPRQKAVGAIESITSAEIPNQDLLMVGLEISIDNEGTKPFLPREVKADIETAKGGFNDQATSAVDVPRYLQAFPGLAGDGAPPLQLENPLQPGAKVKGMIIVTFPISADDFAKRKSLRVTIADPNQQVPLVLTK